MAHEYPICFPILPENLFASTQNFEVSQPGCTKLEWAGINCRGETKAPSCRVEVGRGGAGVCKTLGLELSDIINWKETLALELFVIEGGEVWGTCRV